MPYTLSQLEALDLPGPKPRSEEIDIEMSGGKNVSDLLSQKLRRKLSTEGGDDYEGDYSRQDSAIITAILSAGHSPADVYRTFLSSVRGKNCLERKAGHIEDYLQRTISKALSFLKTDEVDQMLRVNFGGEVKSIEGKDGIQLLWGKDIVIEHPQWLWKPYIPQGKITIIAGDPGLGKSTIVIDLVSRISKGTHLPSGGRTVSGTCVVASAEDAAEDTIGPRLIAANANMDRVAIIREVIIAEERQFLCLPRDIPRLRSLVIQHGARLLVIDPISAFLEKGTDSYKDQDVRSVLAPLELLAEETKVAVLIVSHFTKKEDASALYRVGASIGFVGAARSVLAVSKIAKNDTKVLYSIKSNLTKTPKALAYETRERKVIRGEGDKWEGEDNVHGNSIRWKGEVDYDPAQQSYVSEDQADEEATDFLNQLLLDGEMPTDEIFIQARKAGVKRSQITRVKTEMGIKAVRKGSRWFWKRVSE